MLDYTKAAIRQTLSDLKKTNYIRNVATQIIYIAYLIYVLIVQTGFLAANIVLLVLSAAYLAFFLIVTDAGKDPDGKKFKDLKKNGATVFVWSKRAIRLVTLGMTVYGICTTLERVTPFSIVLTAMMIVGWILQIVFEILIKILTNRVQFILEGLEADLDSLLKPVKTVGNFFKKMTGQEVEALKEPTKNQLKLKEKVEAYRAERKEKLEQAKERRKQEKLNKKQQAQEQKQAEKLENAHIKQEEKLAKRQEKNLLPPPSEETEELAISDSDKNNRF